MPDDLDPLRAATQDGRPAPKRRTASDAAAFARFVHEGHLDRIGRPVIEHLARVAARVDRLAQGCPSWSPRERDEALQIAWLHDVVEAGGATMSDLHTMGFSGEVVVGVSRVTRPSSGVPYTVWVTDAIVEQELSALLVKIAAAEDYCADELYEHLPPAARAKAVRRGDGVLDILRTAARSKGWRESRR